MVMTSSDLNHWILSERANPRRSAEFVFFVKAVIFLKNMKIALTGPFSGEYYITEETGEKCVLHIFFGLCCFPFICQRTGSEHHVMAFSHDIHLVKQCALSVFCFVLLYHVLHSLMLYLSLFLTPRVRLIILKRQNHHRYVMIS